MGRSASIWTKIAELGISPNWGVFAGQGTIRREVIGSEDRDPTRDELDRMRALVAEAMQEGAFGLSTGLFYVPGSFTSTEEVIELSKIAASHGGIYISHIARRGAAAARLGARDHPHRRGGRYPRCR